MHTDVLGSTIFYEINGQGLPIIFVHGLGGTSNVWHGQRQTLSKFYQVITLDLPGSGRSSKNDSTYSMERWAGQIVGLADSLKLDRFVVAGHSMSTITAQKCAAKFPKRILGLVLCGPLTELPAEGKANFKNRADLVRKDGMIAIADAVLGGGLTAATREGNPALTGMTREMLLGNDPLCYAGHCLALAAASAREDQPLIQCPILILEGDQDAVTPLASCQAIAQAVPKTQIRIVPATAHYTMMERPELFNSLLLEFLCGLEMRV